MNSHITATIANVAGISSAAPLMPGTPSIPQQFGVWLGRQLDIKKMTQRQLAERSGVDHSTISRLMHGDRVPSLETAQKLAIGLREPGFGVAVTEGNPVAGVEHALRADKSLSESDIRTIMSNYLGVRARNVVQSAAMATNRAATNTNTVLVRR
jgi:transcriptional regulator with XRE-family HTH domain